MKWNQVQYIEEDLHEETHCLFLLRQKPFLKAQSKGSCLPPRKAAPKLTLSAYHDQIIVMLMLGSLGVNLGKPSFGDGYRLRPESWYTWPLPLRAAIT